jgi:hypothetical protein
MILDMFGYDRHAAIREIRSTLQKNLLNTRAVALAAPSLVRVECSS